MILRPYEFDRRRNSRGKFFNTHEEKKNNEKVVNWWSLYQNMYRTIKRLNYLLDVFRWYGYKQLSISRSNRMKSWKVYIRIRWYFQWNIQFLGWFFRWTKTIWIVRTFPGSSDGRDVEWNSTIVIGTMPTRAIH